MGMTGIWIGCSPWDVGGKGPVEQRNELGRWGGDEVGRGLECAGTALHVMTETPCAFVQKCLFHCSPGDYAEPLI